MSTNPHKPGFWTNRPSHAEMRRKHIEQALGTTVESKNRPTLRLVAFADDAERRRLLDRLPLAELRRVWELGATVRDDILKDSAELARRRRVDGLVPKGGMK